MPGSSLTPTVAPRRAWPVLPALIALLAAFSAAAWQPGDAAATNRTAPAQTPTPTLAPGTGAIAGTAYEDLNANGARETEEPPLAGLEAAVYTQAGALVQSALTAGDGSYRLAGLAPGAYRLAATAPAGYELTTQGSFNLFVSAGAVLSLDFGARFVPTPTPTATPLPQLDTGSAILAACGSVVEGDTTLAANNVSRYSCRPEWPEQGPERVYRLEIRRYQPVTAALLSASADLDLFLLSSSWPESCLASGDTYLTHDVYPGIYYLAVDGYDGAAGAFTLRVECPYEPQASPTPTATAVPTATATPTATPGPSPTPTLAPIRQHMYLPEILRSYPYVPLPPSTLILQNGRDGYAGALDTTLNAWTPAANLGAGDRLLLRYNQGTAQTTHMVPLLRFDTSAVPSTAGVVEARLDLYLLSSERPQDIRAEVYGLLVSWGENAATWLVRQPGLPWTTPGAQGAGTDRMTWLSDSKLVEATRRWYSFDVTDLVGLWAGEPAGNFGLALLAGPGASGANLQVDFASSEHGNAALRPKLTIRYSAAAAAG